MEDEYNQLLTSLGIDDLDPGWSKEGTSSAKYEEEMLRLISIRDFISLLLSYPVKLEEEGILKTWINAFSEWRAPLSSTDDDAVIDKPWRVLAEKALTCVHGLVPMELIFQIKHGKRPIFYHIHDIIPKPILDLTVDLAVGQLIHALNTKDDYASHARYVRMATRNFNEKIYVQKKIALVLEFEIDKDLLRIIWINSSKYESSDAETRIEEEINMMMAGVVAESNSRSKLLAIVVDRDSDRNLNLRKMCFSAEVVLLLITTESLSQLQAVEFTNIWTVDLNIRTQDHLLPWYVFCRYGGISMEHSSGAIQKIAVQIVEQCRGHLLVIVLLAKCLKNVEDVQQWELALHKLSYTNPSFDYQESDRIGISRVMVNAFSNIIWEGINETQRHCLEAILFQHNIKKGVPREILMPTQESPGRFFGFLKAEKKAHDDINELLDRSVLLKCGNGDVYLPIESYDIIKSLHTLNPSIIRHAELGLTEPSYIGRWHALVKIELMDNKICELPQSPYCPKLKELLLQGNVELMDIPDSFFDHMPLLQYLDLSNTSIRNLPPSIFKLTELEKFYLSNCDLFTELPPIIGQLKKLQELDLDETFITHLPQEIRELINLQSLIFCFDKDLGYGSSSTIIPQGVISNLTQLNYLSINVDPEDERWNNVTNILVEIFELEWLKTVNIYIPKAELLDLIPTKTSLNFRLIAGHHKRRFISCITPEVEQKFKHYERSLKFVNGASVPNGVRMILGRSRALYLDRHMTMKSLTHFGPMSLMQLQVCILEECNEMETILDGSYSRDRSVLPNLECLIVFYMKNLRSICEGSKLNVLSFFNLKSAALHTCPMLATIFSQSLLKNLRSLEELTVEDCPKVTTLISRDLSKNEIFSLPRLRKISLLYLPELISIFNGLHVAHRIEQMGFYYCPKLQSLSKSELSSRNLRIIKGERRWWESLRWNKEERGDAGGPNFLDLIFSPVDEDGDIMTQLAAHPKLDPCYHEEQNGRKRKRSISPERQLPISRRRKDANIMSKRREFYRKKKKDLKLRRRKYVTSKKGEVDSKEKDISGMLGRTKLEEDLKRMNLE